MEQGDDVDITLPKTRARLYDMFEWVEENSHLLKDGESKVVYDGLMRINEGIDRLTVGFCCFDCLFEEFIETITFYGMTHLYLTFLKRSLALPEALQNGIDRTKDSEDQSNPDIHKDDIDQQS